MERSLGLVVPAYRPDVGALVDYVASLDEQLAPATILIELDSPRPGVADRLADGPATVNVSDRRRGKGAAVTHGFESLETDVMAFVDADGSTPADSMADVVAPVLTGEAALSVGSRRHPDAHIVSHQTLVRRHLGDVFAAVARRLIDVPLYDYQCGAKAITADAWRHVRNDLYEPGFAWDVELIAMVGSLGLPVAEVPIVWEDQPGSTVSTLGTSLALARTLLLTRHRAKRRAGDPFHGAIGRLLRARPTLVEQVGVDR